LHIWCIKNEEKIKSKPPSISIKVTPKEPSISSHIHEGKISIAKSFPTLEETDFNKIAENIYQRI
jgi:hypothetical protein